MSSKHKQKSLCKCNYCLEKCKDGCWIQKVTYNSHLQCQWYFKQINTKIDRYINPLLLNDDKNNKYETNSFLLNYLFKLFFKLIDFFFLVI
jgi:hypothetical protein